MQQLQVHHLKFRAYGGGDSEETLITLCAAGHKLMHCVRKGTGFLRVAIVEAYAIECRKGLRRR
jgi:5-methylcytosine-specific restriction endonuclease McrA